MMRMCRDIVAHRGARGGVALAALLLVAVSACTPQKDRTLFDGRYYPAKTHRMKGEARAFTATVRRADRGVDGARKAASYAATRYCVENFGTSDVEWRIGPDAPEPEIRKGDRLTVAGVCKLWN